MQPFKKDDYILSFSVHGVSVFVTDIHVDVYKELEVLFLIDNGTFKQYFTKSAYEKALNRGLAFYSDEKSFNNFKDALAQHCATFERFFNEEIKGKEKLSRETVKTFFDYTIKLCKEYTWMNTEHTDKAFERQEENPILKQTLLEASGYKDIVRNYMNTVLFEPEGYAFEVFRIFSNQFDIELSVLQDFMQQEILRLFEDWKPDTALITQRQMGFVINYDRSHVLQGKEAMETIEEFKTDVTHSNVVTGRPASLGKATGPAKIINVDYSDLSALHREIGRMNQGDILIAETTAPELILACKKAAAIVTDIGGQLSHAAIVSREFGIPCIVGTENATKIFRDGDVVEVDADKGIVQKVD